MHELSEPDAEALQQIELRVRLREVVQVDYAQFDRRVQEACAAAATLSQKCKQLQAEGAHAFCTEPDDIVVSSSKDLVAKWIKAMPNADHGLLEKKIVQTATAAHESGKPFSAANLESIVVGAAEALRQAARVKILSHANGEISGLQEGGSVIRLDKPVYGSRRHHTIEYRIGLAIANFEAAAAIILGGADPLTVQSAIATETLPNSLAGGWSIFPSKRRKEKTIPEIRLWASRSEATFETPEDAARVRNECEAAAAQYAAAQAAARADAAANNTGSYHHRWP